MWSTARIALGLSDEQFYSLTPRQYYLLLGAHRERQKHKEWLAGVIASTVANWSMLGRPEGAEPLKPSDFPLALLRTPVKRKRLSKHKIADQIRAAFRAQMEWQSKGMRRV